MISEGYERGLFQFVVILQQGIAEEPEMVKFYTMISKSNNNQAEQTVLSKAITQLL